MEENKLLFAPSCTEISNGLCSENLLLSGTLALPIVVLIQVTFFTKIRCSLCTLG